MTSLLSNEGTSKTLRLFKHQRMFKEIFIDNLTKEC